MAQPPFPGKASRFMGRLAKPSLLRTFNAFDRSGHLTRPPYRRLAAEAWAQFSYRPSLPEAGPLPDGKGHVALVVPAFATTDTITRSLRDFLTRCGYRALGWELGVNWGPTPGILASLRRRLDACLELEGGPVSVVGLSLGGLLARDLAHDRPDEIAHVVTIVSPFRLPTACHLEPLFHLCALFYSDDFQADRLAHPLPMPSTAIYSRDDGVVAWESCRSEEPLGACFETTGAHSTIWRKPEVMALIARRLQPNGM